MMQLVRLLNLTPEQKELSKTKGVWVHDNGTVYIRQDLLGRPKGHYTRDKEGNVNRF